MIKTNLHKPTQTILNRCQALLDQLYGNNQRKPGIQNAKDAILVLIAEKENQDLGFVWLYENTYHPENLFLGNYQCVDEPEAAQSLLQACETFALNENFRALVGPMCGNTWYGYRFSTSVEHFFFLESVHKEEYVQQWMQNGFHVSAEYQSNTERFNTQTDYSGYAAFLEEKNLVLRPFDLTQPEDELRLLWPFCNELFANNVYFSPISEDDFIALYQPLLPLFDPRFVSFVMDGASLVGLFFALPDPYVPGQIVVKTVARNPDNKYRGLAHVMAAHFCHSAIEAGFTSMVHAYFHIDNRSSNLSKNFGGQLLKKHVLLQKPIG
ncbi:MAG: hypothetical protein JJ975_13250 [Bacteroidia bacterium]|nr:hypothetical protein [Bacteroidia bacterium]